jgi:hypothetical protein
LDWETRALYQSLVPGFDVRAAVPVRGYGAARVCASRWKFPEAFCRRDVLGWRP